MKISNVKTDYHRNGIMGVPFYVATFDMKEDGQTHRMVGIVFPDAGECAVLDVDMLNAGNIRFMENSWRGDNFELELRAAIAKKE